MRSGLYTYHEFALIVAEYKPSVHLSDWIIILVIISRKKRVRSAQKRSGGATLVIFG